MTGLSTVVIVRGAGMDPMCTHVITTLKMKHGVSDLGESSSVLLSYMSSLVGSGV